MKDRQRIGSALGLDCGDNSCRYIAGRPAGMRTNGGCRCEAGEAVERLVAERNKLAAETRIPTTLGVAGLHSPFSEQLRDALEVAAELQQDEGTGDPEAMVHVKPSLLFTLAAAVHMQRDELAALKHVLAAGDAPAEAQQAVGQQMIEALEKEQGALLSQLARMHVDLAEQVQKQPAHAAGLRYAVQWLDEIFDRLHFDFCPVTESNCKVTQRGAVREIVVRNYWLRRVT